MKKKTVLILGAGPAGLMAAYTLLTESKDYKVIILEKEQNVGGLSKTVNFKNDKIDYGVHFYRISDYKEINDIIYNLFPIEDRASIQLTEKQKKNYVSLGNDQNNSDSIMLINKATSNIYFNKKFYDYPIKLNLDTIRKIGFVNLIMIGCSYLKVLIHKVEETNLENYYINRYGKRFYEMFFLEYTKKICGVHPKDINIDWGKQRIRDTSLINILKEKFFSNKTINNEPSLINEYYYPKYGSGEIYEKLASEIKKLGGKIIPNSYVKQIEIEANQISNIIYNEQGNIKNMKIDYLISSIPLKRFISLIKDDTLDKQVVKSIKQLPFRDLILVNLVLSKKAMLKLENYKKIKENSWVFIQDPKVSFGRIKICNNWSKYMISDSDNDKLLLTLEYCYSKNDPIAKLSKEELIKQVKKELKYLDLFPKGGIKDYKIDKVKDAYPAYYGTYSNIKELKKSLNKYKQIYFIGRGGQHQYIDMDKAMYTGLIASKDIIKKNKYK